MSEIFLRVGEAFDLLVPTWYTPTEAVKRFVATGIPMTEEMCLLMKTITSGKAQAEDVFPTPSYVLEPGNMIRVRAINIAPQAEMTLRGCIDYLENEDALFPGMFGLMLAYLEIPEFFGARPLPSRHQETFAFYSFKSPDKKERAFLDAEGKVRNPYLRLKAGKSEGSNTTVYTPEVFGHAVYRKVGHMSLLMMFRKQR